MNLKNMVTVDYYSPPMVNVSIKEDGCEPQECEKNCLYVCPSDVFLESGGRIVLNPDGICLECGACRLACDNVNFNYPPAGRGVIHRFG